MVEQENKKEIVVDGVVYVPKDCMVQRPLYNIGSKKYVMVRTYSAGVFAGYLKSHKGREATLLKARRMFWWEGAASLSELAMRGTSKPEKCQFPVEVDEVLLTEVIEILPISKVAQKNIGSVPVWSR